MRKWEYFPDSTKSLQKDETNPLAKVVESIRTLMHNMAYRRAEEVREDIEAHIDTFLDRIRKLLAVFEQVCSLMHKTKQLNMEEQGHFKTLCKKVCDLWRTYYPNKGLTPKMHLLESHAAREMWIFGCMGDKSESEMERLHHINNKSNRRLEPMKTWRVQQETMLKQVAQSDLPEVQNALRTNRRTRQRNFSPQSIGIKQGKAQDDAEVRAAKLNLALEIQV